MLTRIRHLQVASWTLYYRKQKENFDRFSCSRFRHMLLRRNKTRSEKLPHQQKETELIFLSWQEVIINVTSPTGTTLLTFCYSEGHFAVRVHSNSLNATPVNSSIAHFQVWYCYIECVPIIFYRVLPLLLRAAFYQDVCVNARSFAEIFDIGGGIRMRACYCDWSPHSSCYWHGFSLKDP